MWERIDTLLHRVHLPIGFVCDRLDLSLGITREELRRKVPLSREFSVLPQPAGWSCPHATITASVPLTSASVGGPYGCGCTMTPYYATRSG